MTGSSKSQDVISSPAAPLVVEARGIPVMLDFEVAERFGVQTRTLNQAVARNPEVFTGEHCFRLDKAETDALRSQSVISTGSHGGFKGEPMVYSILGVAQVATHLRSVQARRATDLMIRTFLDVQAQVVAGKQLIAVHNPNSLVPDDDPAEDAAFRKKLRAALHRLLDLTIDVKTGASVGETVGALTAEGLAHLKERLKTRGLENEKLAAETALIIQQAELTASQVRKSDAETKGIELANLVTQIGIVKQITDLHDSMQAPALIKMLGRLNTPQDLPRLSGPDKEDPA